MQPNQSIPDNEPCYNGVIESQPISFINKIINLLSKDNVNSVSIPLMEFMTVNIKDRIIIYDNYVRSYIGDNIILSKK